MERLARYLQKSASSHIRGLHPLSDEGRRGLDGKIYMAAGVAGASALAAHLHDEHRAWKAAYEAKVAGARRLQKLKNGLGFGLAGAAGLAGVAYRMKGDRDIAAHVQKWYEKWDKAIKVDHAIADAESAARSKEYKDSVIDYIDSKRGK